MGDLPAPREQRARLDRLDTDRNVLEALAERVANGVSAVEVAHDYGVSFRRLNKWLDEEPERRAEYEAAKEAFAERLAYKAVKVADDCDAETGVPKARLQSDVYLKIAGKRDRKNWGEKEQGALAGGVTVNLIQFSEAQILAGAPGRQGRVIESLAPMNSTDAAILTATFPIEQRVPSASIEAPVQRVTPLPETPAAAPGYREEELL